MRAAKPQACQGLPCVYKAAAAKCLPLAAVQLHFAKRGAQQNGQMVQSNGLLILILHNF